MRIWLLLLALLAGGNACAYPAPEYVKVKPTTLRLEMPGGICSGTAVGHHVVLTAAHCAEDGTEGWRIGGRTARITSVRNDGMDHVLLTVDLYFEDIATFGPPPKQGDEVFTYGNPGGTPDILLFGHVAGWIAHPVMGRVMLLDRNDWFGCSGAAVFDKRGRIVGVVNAVYSTERTYIWRLTAVFPLGFGPKDVS